MRPPPIRKSAPPPPPAPAISRRKRLVEMSRAERKADASFTRTHLRMLKASLAFYCSEVLRGPEEYDGRFMLGPHHIDWSEAVKTENRILALAARDHGKSHFWCFGYVLWMIDRKAPGRVGYIFSASTRQAQEHLDKIRQEILGGGENGGPNPKLAHLLPFKKDSASTIKFANGSEIRARGFGSRVRGGHPFWLVADDVGNDEWIYSETVREKAIDYFLSAVRPMVVPGGQLIVVGTPFHAQDLYAALERTDVYHVIKNPAIDARGRPLWPARYDRAALDRTRKELANALRFSREYLCKPISDESSLFPSYLFDAPGIKQPYQLGQPGSYWTQMGAIVYMGVDLALSASAGADYFVCFLMAVMPNGDRFIVDIIRRKGLGFQQQLDTIIRVAKHYHAALVFCEANQFQRVVTDEVVRKSDVPIKAFYTTGRRKVTAMRLGMSQTYSANKHAFDQGVPALRMLFENGKIRIPWAPETRETVELWITEMQSFGWADGKLQGVGAHDDTVMALWICDHACRTGGVSFSFGDDEDAADLDFDSDSEEDSEEEDFFGNDMGGDDWRPREGVGISW